MVPSVALAGLSARGAFFLSAILMTACFILAVVSALSDPNPLPCSGFAGLTLLLALTTAYTAWLWKWSEEGAKTPPR